MILDFGDGFFLRRATADDHEALCMVCLKTGDAGADATWREDDSLLMGQIYAVPYQVLEPDLAFAIEGPEGVAGYLLGVLDTRAFNTRLEAEWYPALKQRIADPGDDRQKWRGSDWARHAIRHPDFTLPDALAAYPSHGHIDLLAAARGRGIGWRCMALLEERLAAAGSSGLFLDVNPRNTKARAFYARLGYRRAAVARNRGSLFMAKALPGPRSENT
jgi:ribosomal protein S18 acetylase RimI-like enzyme